MKEQLRDKLNFSLNRFIDWFENYGEVSQDQHDFWASSLGRRAKSFYYRAPFIGSAVVAPFVVFEAFIPSVRRWFSPPRRFPIADAHYAMGFSHIYKSTKKRQYLEKGKNFLSSLKRTRCQGYQYYCWGYPFDWETCRGTFKAGTPLITSTPYVYEAFKALYEIDHDNQWLEIMNSIADHALHEIREVEIAPGIRTCSYSPIDQRRVVNANAYRAFLLAEAAQQFSKDEYWNIGEKNLNFVLQSQQPDGSWLYAMEDGRDCFIDHFHTCFVLKNLVKVERITNCPKCKRAIERGVEFYLNRLIDKEGLPKPFAKTQRVTLYRRELYDYAESINLALILRERFGNFNKIIESQLSDLLSRWQKSDGSFRTRELLLGWNNVPYHRWAQSQIFRSLSFWFWLEHQDK